jgi:hypothetical protein
VCPDKRGTPGLTTPQPLSLTSLLSHHSHITISQPLIQLHNIVIKWPMNLSENRYVYNLPRNSTLPCWLFISIVNFLYQQAIMSDIVHCLRKALFWSKRRFVSPILILCWFVVIAKHTNKCISKLVTTIIHLETGVRPILGALYISNVGASMDNIRSSFGVLNQSSRQTSRESAYFIFQGYWL